MDRGPGPLSRCPYLRSSSRLPPGAGKDADKLERYELELGEEGYLDVVRQLHGHAAAILADRDGDEAAMPLLLAHEPSGAPSCREVGPDCTRVSRTVSTQWRRSGWHGPFGGGHMGPDRSGHTPGSDVPIRGSRVEMLRSIGRRREAVGRRQHVARRDERRDCRWRWSAGPRPRTCSRRRTGPGTRPGRRTGPGRRSPAATPGAARPADRATRAMGRRGAARPPIATIAVATRPQPANVASDQPTTPLFWMPVMRLVANTATQPSSRAPSAIAGSPKSAPGREAVGHRYRLLAHDERGDPVDAHGGQREQRRQQEPGARDADRGQQRHQAGAPHHVRQHQPPGVGQEVRRRCADGTGQPGGRWVDATRTDDGHPLTPVDAMPSTK